MFTIISDGKNRLRTLERYPELVGLSENHAKKHKKCDFSKRARQKILKIGKIHVIYVYIKNQKQTDELPKSQVGCVLGEVWAAPCAIYKFMQPTSDHLLGC